MDLNHYFNPVDFSAFAESSPVNWKYSIGAAIEKYTLRLNKANLGKVEVVIVGIPFENQKNECVNYDIPNLIRKELYQLKGLGKINLVDLGNLKQASSNKGNILALRDVVDYLSELNIITIVLGGSQDFSYGICQAYRGNKLFSFSTVDAFLDVRKGKESFNSENYLSRIFSGQPDIFQFGILGCQKHYVPDIYLSKIKAICNPVRLGVLREDLTLADPVLRNSDFVSIDYGTLKYTESFGKHKLPNGLHSEEICQLSRYAGMSSRLKVLGLFEVVNNEINIQLAAQSCWYFLEGVLSRCALKPEDGDGFKVFKVEITDVDSPLVFYQNIETGQWWIQFRSLSNKIVYVACSEQDYIDATLNEIPELWLKYIQKIDEILK